MERFHFLSPSLSLLFLFSLTPSSLISYLPQSSPFLYQSLSLPFSLSLCPSIPLDMQYVQLNVKKLNVYCWHHYVPLFTVACTSNYTADTKQLLCIKHFYMLYGFPSSSYYHVSNTDCENKIRAHATLWNHPATKYFTINIFTAKHWSYFNISHFIVWWFIIVGRAWASSTVIY